MSVTAINRYPGLFYDLARGKHTFLSLSQPIMGAVIAISAVPSARVMALGLLAATSGYFAVYSLNDILDHQIDRKSLEHGKADRDDNDIGVAVRKHPLAWGDLSLAVSVSWVAALGLFSLILAWLLAPACALAFAGCVGLEVIYCTLRRVTWLKTVISGAMVSLGALAGWLAVAPLDLRAIYLFIFLMLWEIFGRNLSNDLADVVSDRSVGIRTVAVTFSNRTAARAILTGACLTVIFPLVMPLPWISRAIAIAVGIPSMLLPALALVKEPTSEIASAYFNKASYYPTLFLIALIPLLW
ncbi:MAG: UbiA prenyltransferase family protein [Thermoleophilia bacterium]